MNSVYDNGGSAGGGSGRGALGGGLSDILDRAGRILGRIGFGLFMVLAIGATLLATTFVGIFLAIAAGFLTLTQKLGGRSRKRAAQDAREEGPPPTLEAHRTADGWVTEPVRRD